MRISNIIWDVDMDDVYENLDEMTAEKQRKLSAYPKNGMRI